MAALLRALLLTMVGLVLACRTIPLEDPAAISAEGSVDEVEEAVLMAAAASGWRAQVQEGRWIRAFRERGPHGAVIGIDYRGPTIQIRYLASTRLNCPTGGRPCERIHRVYGQWLSELQGKIAIALRDPNSPELTPIFPREERIAEVQVSTTEPGRGFEQIGSVSAVHGGGCGRYGWGGSYDGAYDQLRVNAASIGADYVQIIRISEPHLATPQCFDNRFSISGTAYRLSAARDGGFDDGESIGGRGSGIVVDSQGAVLTNFHVVSECNAVSVVCRGVTRSAVVVASDRQSDLALLAPDATCGYAATFRTGRRVRTGDTVFAIGFPLQGQLASTPSMTDGLVSNQSGPENDSRLLQFTAPIQPGNSGGPLLDESGRVVGVVVATLNPFNIALSQGTLPQNVNFAIHASLAQLFLDGQGVKYRTGSSIREISPADVAEEALGFVVPVACD